MHELEQYIKPYFGKVNDTDLENIVSMFEPETLEKGDFLTKTGCRCRKLSFVKSGMLRVFAYSEEKEVTQWISTASYFTTDLASFIFESPARWTIQALTDVELFTISRSDYKKLGDLVPKWHELEKMFLVRCFTLMEDRIFSHLSMSAEERYQFFFQHNQELFNQVPQQYLASMLGMTPETFSRIRKKQLL